MSSVKAPPFRDGDKLLLEAALDDADPDIRRAAIFAVGYVEWPELEERVRRMEAEDPDAAVRETAGRLREAIEHRETERHG